MQIKQQVGFLLRDRSAPARLPAVISASLGLAALIGWSFDLPTLGRLVPGAVVMKANTAACVVLCSIALWILAREKPSAGPFRLARGLSLGVMVIALMTLAEYLFGWRLGIDEMLFKDTANADDVLSGRMSPVTAAAFAAIAGALTALPFRRLHGAVTWAAAAAVVAGLVSLLGYLWNAVEIVTDRFLPSLAFNTACCLALLGSGILLCPGKTAVDATGKFIALAALEMKILAGFIVALSLLLAGSAYTYRTIIRVAAAAEWVAHTQEVRAVLASLYGSLADAEAAQRDYVLTSEPLRRDEYERSMRDVQAQLGNLRGLTADNPEQGQNVAALSALLAVRPLALRRVRELTGHMAAIEARLLGERQMTMARVRENTLVAFLATLAVAGGVFTALFRGVHREVLSRRSSESDLREANRFLDSLIESLPIMVALKDADSLRYVRLNRTVERLMGRSRSELIGRSVHDFLPPEAAEAVSASDREALASEGVVDNQEHRVDTATLGPRIFHTMKMPIRDPDGRPRYVLSISTDITERKLTEQAIRELNSALVSKAEQLTASNRELESFSYSVSHDLRAPLRAVDGFAQMLEEDYGARLDAEGIRYLSVIRSNTQRMGTLIDDLLEFSRLGRLPIAAEVINVDSLVREVVGEALEGHPAAPLVEIGPLPPVRGDRTLLRQVWMNLIVNAIKFSGKAAQPRIEVSGRQNARENVYSVCDNGVGFDMEYADKLFGVFQRLHRPDEFSGTGVGLAIVQRVVTRHGGRVWADGIVNGGAMFSFRFRYR